MVEQVCDGQTVDAYTYSASAPHSFNVQDLGTMAAPPHCDDYKTDSNPWPWEDWRHNNEMTGPIKTAILQADLVFQAQKVYAPGKCNFEGKKDDELTTNTWDSIFGQGFLTGLILGLPVCGDLTAKANGVAGHVGPVGVGLQVGWDIHILGTLSVPNPLRENRCGLVPMYGILQIQGDAFGVGV